MKKLVTILLAGIIAFSVTACGGDGGGSSKDKDAQLKKEVLDATNEAYSGVTAAGGSMYYLSSTDGKFAVLVLEGKSEDTYIRFIGSATKDDDIISVTDKASGNKFSFSAEQQDEGYFLDCGNLGECYVSPSPKEDVVDYIFTTFNEMKDVTSEVMAELGTPIQSDGDAAAEDDGADTEEDGADDAEEETD